MAGTSLLALIDDIAVLLDDTAAMTKIATRKTAGVLGDDLALNAEQVTGVRTDRELPVVWAVALGSLKNKAILVPSALVISAVAPWLITPLLMLGGAFLCYEGFEKVAHKLLHRNDAGDEHEARREALATPEVDMVAFERERIKGAIRTDFILSAEIIVLSLAVVAQATWSVRVMTLVAIALVMTIGVYGLVAAIVKLDDAGLALRRRPGATAKAIGRGILVFAPLLMKGLSLAGTIAMFLVGGGILAHGIPPIHRFEQGLAKGSGLVASLGPTLLQGLVGLVAGALLVAVAGIGAKLVSAFRSRQ